ncbi:Uncharacterized protein HZ326_4618 [Fusarium oxysporum f. sp. albedinis]|nr:Uncharacterized protein HZ326_4618 [Fusarium oxysporum f. sp. albedinis]
MICYRVTDAVTLIRNQVPSQMFPVQPIMLQRRIQNHPLALSSDPSKINRVRDSGYSAKKQWVSALEPETFSTRARTITRCRSYCKGRVLVILSSRAIRSLVQRRLNLWVSVIKYLNSFGVQERTVETQKSKTEKALPCEDEWRLDGSPPLSIAR